MAKNGREKGANFERRVAELFAAALNIKLRRTPMSGGWSHGNPDVAGDLVCIEGQFPYCVECKCAEGWKMETLFSGNHMWFDNWWAQLMKECPTGRIPLLVFSRARQPIFVAFSMKSGLWQGISVHTIAYINMPNDAVAVTLLEDLLDSLKRNLVEGFTTV